jgi:hypothetical protein
VREHRLLLAAALLAVLLTTSVLAMLAAFSGAIGDAALRRTLETRDTTATSLVVRADVTAEGRAAAVRAFDAGARRTFDGLPVHRETLTRSGPYGLPGTGRAPGGKPDLTQLASIEPSEVRITAGRLPRQRAGRVLEAALPETAARRLKLKTGDRLTLKDRLGGPSVTVELTGVWRPARPQSPYWTLDALGGRGVLRESFTTYGPLMTAPSVVESGKVSDGTSAWLASADFRTATTDRIPALRDAARAGTRQLLHSKDLAGTTEVRTSLPDVLDRAERALLVERSTLLIVSLQLVLLAGYTLLLVARLLSTERTDETRTLRARGGSRAQIVSYAAVEAVLLALPAALCAPLLAGPLTRLVAGQGALSRIGLRLDGGAGGPVWLVSGAVALGCALAVTLPALTGAGAAFARGRAKSLPGPVRAGADVGLLVVAGVAYWQLSRRTSGAGTLTGGGDGTLGIDPLLVVAPALALLAGTVLTLRLVPPVARLAERRAAKGRGLSAALAGWQFSRRPMRSARAVLLLVLAVAMGMLAIGQGASWDRSQEDQADFRSGTAVRVLATEAGMDEAGGYTSVPGVRQAAPAQRSALPLDGGRTASVLALDTTHVDGDLMLRPDLAGAGSSPQRLLDSIRPKNVPVPGIRLPKNAERARFTLRATHLNKPQGAVAGASTSVSVTVEDRYGLPYPTELGDLPLDGRPHTLTMDLGGAAGPLTVTGLSFDTQLPLGNAPARHRVTLEAVTTADAAGRTRAADPGGVRWNPAAAAGGAGGVGPVSDENAPKVQSSKDGPRPTVTYSTGFLPEEELGYGVPPDVGITLTADRPPSETVRAIASDLYLQSTGGKVGRSTDIQLGGTAVRIRIVGRVKELPTTSAADTADGTKFGGALLLDLGQVNRALADGGASTLAPNEWWLSAAPGDEAKAAAALRARPDIDPAQVVVRSELGAQLRDDPLGAGPQSALTAATVAAAALAAVGFAVNALGSLRERNNEFALLGALGASRRRLARLAALEQGVLVALALAVGLALGTFLTRAVVPLIVLTRDATRPVPDVLVRLPLDQVALLLAGVAAAPALVTLALALRRPPKAAAALRAQGGE